MVDGLNSDLLENAAPLVEAESRSAHEPVPIPLRQEVEPNVQGQLRKQWFVMWSLVRVGTSHPLKNDFKYLFLASTNRTRGYYYPTAKSEVQATLEWSTNCISYEMFSCVVLLSILPVVPYFGEPVGRDKKQTTSKTTQLYCTPKRLIIKLFIVQVFQLISLKAGKAKQIEKRSARSGLVKLVFYSTK